MAECVVHPPQKSGFTWALPFQSKTIRCVDVDEDVWFVAKDGAEAPWITWASSILANIKKKWIGARKLRTPVRQHDGSTGVVENNTVLTNEAAVYKLASRSNKPAVEAFTDWVYEEVLPSIRKTGMYIDKRRAQPTLQRNRL